MKKIAFILILAVLLSSCGQQKQAGEEQNNLDTEVKTEVASNESDSTSQQAAGQENQGATENAKGIVDDPGSSEKTPAPAADKNPVGGTSGNTDNKDPGESTNRTPDKDSNDDKNVILDNLIVTDQTPAVQDDQSSANDSGSAKGDADSVKTVKASITLENGGVIELELFPDIAPQSVYNFAHLARKGFYNGLIFHRVIEGFMIQGGDPEGTGMGGPGYCIKGEFATNGVDNNISHKRGVISMARKGSPMDSAGSQFFIVHNDSQFLDGQYAAFGRVTKGMERVDEIAKTATDASDRPLADVKIKTISINGPELPEPERLPAV